MKAYLQRINPDTGDIWYYDIQIQPDLLGRWHVVRNWGRDGASGTMRQTPYDTIQDAMNGFQEVKEQLVKRGYRVVMQEGMKPSQAALLRSGEESDDH